MLATVIFYLIVLLTAVRGLKTGLTRSGKLAATLFIVGYFPLWTLEMTIRACGFVPAEYAKFLPAGVFLLEAIVGAAIMGAIWKKLSEKFPSLDDSPSMAGMPRLNAVCGAILGGAAGFMLAGTIFCVAAMLPVEIPLLGRRNVVLRARSAAMGTARVVNALAPENAASVKTAQRQSAERLMPLPEVKPDSDPKAESKADPKTAKPRRAPGGSSDRTAIPTLSPSGSSSVYGNAIQRAKKTTRDAEKSRSNLDENL